MIVSIGSAIKSSVGGAGVTTDPIDTTGGDLIVACASWYAGGTAGSLSSSKGGAPTALTLRTGGGTSVRLYYWSSPAVGVGHTFTYTGGNNYPVLTVHVFSGAHAAPFVVENGAIGASPGTVTPTENGSLIIAGRVIGEGSITGINQGFTKLSDNFLAGQHMAGGQAYLIQGAVAAVNPTWTDTLAAGGASAIAVFRPAVAASVFRHWWIAQDPMMKGIS
jgi:hypothetical protein